ncbi:MAG: ferritin-like domain-containing protein [Polyangiaceae bacterium]
MRAARPARELASIFALALTACGAGTEGVDGTVPPVGSANSTPTAHPSATATAVATATATSSPRPDPPPHDDSTPEGYASALQSIGSYRSALSGLELLGFGDVVDGKLKWGGEDCPSEWNTLVDGTFTRAAIVRKSRTLAVITAATFFQWVGPIDTPEKAALRAQLEDGRTLATCGRVKAQGFACAAGSDDDGIAVRVVEGGFEVATYDERGVCGHGRYGAAVALGLSRVAPDGATSEARNVFTEKTYEVAKQGVPCHYPIRGRGYEGFVDAPPEADERAWYLRAIHQEAAAAIAFDRLAAELERHGAPRALVEDTRVAAADERRHADAFRAALGVPGESTDAPAHAFAERPLVELLLENAREGCANETYAAVIATHQAAAAPSALLRAVLAGIAPDEQRHAELAHRVHAWGLTRLDAEDAARVRRELARATLRLARRGGATEAALALGEPSPRVARAAFGRVVSALVSG